MGGEDQRGEKYSRGTLFAVMIWTGIMQFAGPVGFASDGGAVQGLVMQTWQELLSEVMHGLEKGEFSRCFVGLEQLYQHYSQELKERPEIEKWTIPLYAELLEQHGQTDEAIVLFKRYVADFSQAPMAKWVCIRLVDTYLVNQDWIKAEDLLAMASRVWRHDQESGWFDLKRAELKYNQGKTEEAYLLCCSIKKNHESSLALLHATQTLVLGQIADETTVAHAYSWLDQNRPLHEEDWDVFANNEAKIQLADRLVQLEQYPQAIRVYRQTERWSVMLDKHQEQVRKLARRVDQESGNFNGQEYSVENRYAGEPLFSGILERKYWQGLLEKLQRLEPSNNDLNKGDERAITADAVRDMRYAQALDLAQRYREAWILWKKLARQNYLPLAYRRESHYRWLLNAVALQKWTQALEIATEFMDDYPETDEIPYVCFTIAQVLQEQNRIDEAIVVLNDLIKRFPQHDYIARWYYSRGYLNVLSEDYEAARQDYAVCQNKQLDDVLTGDVLLWTGFTYYFEKDYEQAVRVWQEAMHNLDKSHRLYPDFVYRSATAYRLWKNEPKALQLAESLVEKFPLYARVDEAWVMIGEIWMGQGKWQDALHALSNVAEDSALYEHSLFQQVKIHRAAEQYLQMQKLLVEYLFNKELGVHNRMAEAMHWLVWLSNQPDANQQEEIVAVGMLFDRLFERYGNCLTEYDLNQVLEEWRKYCLKVSGDRTRSSGVAIEDVVDGTGRAVQDKQATRSGLFSGPEEKSSTGSGNWWLFELEKARNSKLWTWYSRLQLLAYRTTQEAIQKWPEEWGPLSEYEENFEHLYDQLSLQDMDPEVIGKLGNCLLYGRMEEAENCYEYLEKNYFRTPLRAIAWLGMARVRNLQARYVESLEYCKLWMDDFADHPARVEVWLLCGQNYTLTGEYESAIAAFEEVLKLREARGRKHVEALTGMAKVWELAGQTDKALAVWQRLYTMYPAFTDWVQHAYVTSARLFEHRGDIQAALNCWRILLDEQRYAETLDRDFAVEEIRRLENLI